MDTILNPEGKASWQKIVAAYSKPDLRKSVWQTINSLIPYFALFYISMRSVDISLWLTIPLALLTAGFMARTFIIFHDCGHGSFFASQRANDWLGVITGILTFTPYHRWKHEHAIHHATGDVRMMTLQEYLDAPWRKRLGYRVMRNPFALFLIGPLLMFVVAERIPPSKGRREIASVWWTNLALAALIPVMGFTFGWKNYLAEIIRLPEGTLEAKMLSNKPININLANMSVYSFNFSVSGYTFTPTAYSGGNYQVLAGKNAGQTLVAFT